MDENTELPMVREAARAYVASPLITTMSSKRQITIPAEVEKELGLEPGAKLEVYVSDNQIILKQRPRNWLEYVTSGPPIYGRNKQEVDAYIRDVREGWDERARRYERETPNDPGGD
jgi:AbrB family looped-hinge helix DNA binding protein